ncbi:TrbG/VirB9 family P-type conjugative transfer protein, partial [Bordetella petrii]|uniref:TrbG/VirB9 family P-type conjugative transfer protein n=1 Tax=Bordetella petrii TaxID=94624 RepID=UPI001E3495CB
MVRVLLLALTALGLAGCAPWPGRPRDADPGILTAGHYDFNWQLSGDAAVAPLQVFSGAGRTWLQFAPGRTPPALFAQTPGGLQPLPYTRQDPYVIVDGVWPALILRGGHQVARADRQALPLAPGAALPAPTTQGL